MEYGSTKMEERLSRSPGGKLALWAFYTWCGYFVWAMARYIWVMSRIPDAPVSGFESDLGSTAGKVVRGTGRIFIYGSGRGIVRQHCLVHPTSSRT
ncbi:cell division protein DrpB [Escherichia coli]|nr:cell division protein DrpB [Escherichia coli]